MATATHSSTSKSSSRKSASGKSTARKTASARQKDAIQLLKADHREVEKLFGQFEKASGEARKRQLADRICMELTIHTQIEEEIFYPASREFLKDDEIVNEAIVEHQAAKDLIEQIRGMDASDEMFDAKVTVLQEQIEHHVEEEEKEYFPQCQKSDMDLKALGEQLMQRKKQLQAQMKGDGMEMH
ncbi:hemerythrin domain-containing protein [Phenylobacterium soli]|uniref:Hemerythrin domain-containing protein n=1 Tax=Phenylobacterium soli TaxID=2170551 RepID=A0A328AKV0_9CAUL|nr:hemerythrin domain-containing protein [Phenylobacterium soli]RAK55025.1 hemerythrin domain-containing protein [Phenylobacterium soli]